MNQVAVRMTKTKDTKNMVRYDLAGDVVAIGDKLIPNIYVSQKSLQKAFGKIPEQITVLVQE